MKLEEIGHEIRRARLARGLTQAQLASAAKLTRTTLNQFENGVIKDLGIRKVEALLDQLSVVRVSFAALASCAWVRPRASLERLISWPISSSFTTFGTVILEC